MYSKKMKMMTIQCNGLEAGLLTIQTTQIDCEEIIKTKKLITNADNTYILNQETLKDL